MNETEQYIPEEAQNFKMPEDTEEVIQEEPQEPGSNNSASTSEESLSPEKPRTFDEAKDWLNSESTQEAMQEVKEKYMQAFATLYEMLPRQGKVKKDDILEAMPEIKSLMEMGPAVRIQIAETIADKKLNEEKKIYFIKTLLKLENVGISLSFLGAEKAKEKEKN